MSGGICAPSVASSSKSAESSVSGAAAVAAAASGSTFHDPDSASTIIPHLPTPDAFPFPYAQPYSIQLDLMRTVFTAIEDRKIAIVESPTGTGKSLTLLTSTLSWLAANAARLITATEADLRAKFRAQDPDEPEWMTDGAVRRHLAALRATADARAERLRRARERERRARERRERENAVASGGFGTARKRARPPDKEVKGKSKAERDLEALLPDDAVQQSDDGPNLSAEVRALMAQLEGDRPKAEEEEEEEDVPKVYFASRTHSQLRQLTAELLKTKFAAGKGEDGEEGENGQGGMSLVPLASRRQMCINDRVRSLRGETQINEACLDMQKGGSGSTQRCEFLPPKSDEGTLLDARDSVLATVRDIEDLVTEGRASKVCPYYSTRRAVKSAQLVTLPYNLLLQKSAREALGIDLTDQIVVIDEAHNLIDTVLGIYSNTLPASHIRAAGSQLTQYLARFRTRLKGRNALMIQQTLAVLRGLVRVTDAYAKVAKQDRAKARGEIMNTNELVTRVGGAADAINVIELLAYLKESKLARKISGFAELLEEEREQAAQIEGKEKRSSAARHASIAAFHAVEAFLLSLTDSHDDGRVILQLDAEAVVIKYVLLNPAQRFADVVNDARSVVLAGGTMAPMSDFFTQLFPTIPRDRFATISCAHVIPPENLLTQVVCRGPRRADLEFKFANREDGALIADLGALLQSAIGLVPDGVVVFVPSYSFLDKLKAAWGGDSGLLAKLDQRKQVFYEPQTSAEVDATLRDYALAIEAPAPNAAGRPRTGALLFAVVGGKLSEGINFSDRLGRCVVMVGLPFANVGSMELQERMCYVERTGGKDAGKELYENLCMRTVNQCIGRAIRHANDYAAILLLDRRYGTARIRKKLPRWIDQGVAVQNDWGDVAKKLAAFFRQKRGSL